jgi:hypothetical protein
MAWKQSINIKPALQKGDDLDDDDKLPEGIKDEVVGELARVPALTCFIEEVKHCETVGEFNDILDDIYDVADKQRIWLGL